MRKNHEVFSSTEKAFRALTWAFMAILAIFTLFPIIYVIFGSFKENLELLVGGSNIFPKTWRVENYTDAWEQANFAVYTKNSLFLSVGVMVLSLLNATMAGYSFSRGNFRGKNLLYSLLVMFMFLSVGSISIRPLYELAIKLKVNQSLWAVIFITAGSAQATYIFLSRSFFESIPRELDEAAKIDGCSFFQTFTKIILPMSKPRVGTIALLSFRTGWNAYIVPRVFTLANDSMRPLTVGVNMLKNSVDGAAAWNIMFAGSTIAIVPMLVVYCLFSKHFMSNSTSGAVKG